MNKNPFVSKDIAKRMRSLGFEEPCLGIYFDVIKQPVYRQMDAHGSDYTLAPLTQQALDWFRTHYKISGVINYRFVKEGKRVDYNFAILNETGDFLYKPSIYDYVSYYHMAQDRLLIKLCDLLDFI